jgi:hypothetical protein
MSFQWLQMRIQEETDRREREAQILGRLPRALEELREFLAGCLESYTGAFGAESAELQAMPSKIRVVIREKQDGEWQECAIVGIASDPTVPGFRVDRGTGDPLTIEVGILPGEKIFYRDATTDEYLTMDELTRRVLDRALFPKLRE